MDDEDPFDTLLTLEQQYHTEGYNLGVADGSRSGRIEGRTFGLEKGFEKFAQMGRLGGRAAVWNARLAHDADASGGGEGGVRTLGGSGRLRKHVQRLKDLTDAETLSMENSEDAVTEFEDRVKDARAKAALIERIVGEDGREVSTIAQDEVGSATKTPTKSLRVKKTDTGKSTGEMEDFVGLPGAKRTTNT